MQKHRIQKIITELYEVLDWGEMDDIVVEIGGTAVSGIHQSEDANPKWSSQFGTRKYNKDAFIVIKNKDRNPVTPSKPNEETSIEPARSNDDSECSNREC